MKRVNQSAGISLPEKNIENEFAVHTREELVNMLKQARWVRQGWSETPLQERIHHLRRIKAHLLEHADEIAGIISRATNKTIFDALSTEVLSSIVGLDFFCRKAPLYLKERPLPLASPLFFTKRSKIIQAPRGVVGIIAPWNYPWAIPFVEIVSALLTGNAVIFKTASKTLSVGDRLVQAFEAAGLPNGLFTCVNMPGNLLGDALLEEGIDKLFFTGSVATGKILMRKAAETLTPLSLELGGNDPMLVLADANLSRAVNGALWAGLQNCGQTCGGVERIYVHESRYEEFLSLAASAMEALRIGPGESFTTDIGALTTSRQVETVKSQVEEALAAGARIRARTPVPPGSGDLYLPLVLLTDVDHTMRIMREETFGPVLTVMPFKNIEEAIALANDSHLGLTASVWSRNSRLAERIGRRLQAGVITLNDHAMSHAMPQTPWGGFKQSGIGRTRGKEGFLEMCQPQVIVTERFPRVKRNLWWLPYSRKLYEGIKGAMMAIYGTRPGKRLRGMGSFLKIVGRMLK